MMGEEVEVTIRLPGRDEKGFLRRMREARAIIDANGGPEMWEKMATHLVDKSYVEVPAGVDPHEAIADLSQADIQRIIASLLGLRVDDEDKADDKAVNPPNDA